MEVVESWREKLNPCALLCIKFVFVECTHGCSAVDNFKPHPMTSFNTLRAATNRLTSTPIDALPHQVGYLSNSIAACKDVLRSQSLPSDQSVVVHKLKTRTSALLQDRTAEGRFCGITIARTLLEAGGTAGLSESNNLVRNLISCLNKADPWELKSVCVSSITRVYLLTAEHQALVREITTPTLPAFITASLSIIKPTTLDKEGNVVRALSPLLHTVLRSWRVLIKHFASTFRPYVSSIKSICLSLIEDGCCHNLVQSAAADVLVVLHFCAPRNTATLEWSQICLQVIDAAHDTADLVFRAIEEDWKATSTRASKVTQKQKTANKPATTKRDVLGLEKWDGISQGFQRLGAHVALLKRCLTSQHDQDVGLPLGSALELTSRLSAITPATSKFALRSNPEVTREEREEMWLYLPIIHAQILDLFEATARTFKQALFPVSGELVSQFWEVFESSYNNPVIRATAYKLVKSLLETRLLHCVRSESAKMRRLISLCCEDLLSQPNRGSFDLVITGNGNPHDQKSHTSNSLALNGTEHKSPGLTDSFFSSELYVSAQSLLPAILTYAPLHAMIGGPAMRAQIDSTAILLNHQESIFASVLNPYPPRQSVESSKEAQPNPSTLPFLARSVNSGNATNQQLLGVDALLRPRMPVLSSHTNAIDVSKESEDMEMDSGEDIINEDHMDNTRENETMNVQPLASMDSEAKFPAEGTGAINSAPSSLLTQSSFYPQKRDFTALLEQSADAQLAASALEGHPLDPTTINGHNLAESLEAKRLRIAGDEDPSVRTDGSPVATTSDQQAGESANTKELTYSIEIESKSTGEIVSDEKGKTQREIGYESDNSSNSDIPPIDATLVGMSDSDEDED